MTRPVDLSGVDVFHIARDRAMRARGLPGNHCAFVAELEGRIDVDRLKRRVSRAFELCPELGFRLKNGFPPRFVPGGAAPPITLRRGDEPVEALLPLRVDGDRPFAIDVVRGEKNDRVALRWFHPFADGKAAERLLRWIGSGDGDEPEPPPAESERFDPGPRALASMKRGAALSLARSYNRHVVEVVRAPIMSLATGLSRSQAPGATRALRVTLDEAETAAFDQRVRKVAKLAETSLMLVAGLRALDTLFRRRGFAPALFLVPLPLSLDPKVGAKRLFGNNLTMMMLALTRAELADDAVAITRLAEQQRAIIKGKLDVAMLAALDVARFLPSSVYLFIEGMPTKGEFCSLFVSNPGTVQMTKFAGSRVLDAYPLPSVVVPPGAQVIFTRFLGRLSALFIYLDGVVSKTEAELFLGSLRKELTSS